MKPRSTVLCIITLWTIISILLGGTTPANAAPSVKAFPGAAGYGTDTPGGRGGKVIYVTNLNDAGSGSLRDALTQSGPRMVLFKVTGTISLGSDIEIKQPFMTVAGHTAPGEGVQIRGAQIKISSHDIVMRYLKVRSGDARNSSSPDERDAIAINDHTEAYNIVIDHCTMIWGSDIGGITFLNGSRDSTVSNSIMGEGLYYSTHSEGVAAQGGHSMTMNITELNSGNHPTRITVHHNLLTTSSDRNPRVIGGELIEIVNNVIYNWMDSPSQGNPRSLDLVNNFYIKGPMTTKSNSMVAWLPKAEAGMALRSGTVFESGNVVEGLSNIRGGSSNVYVPNAFGPGTVSNLEDAKTAYNRIVDDAGANMQVGAENGEFRKVRDSVDQRIINNLVNRTGTFVNGLGHNGEAGFPEISWPNLAGGPVAVDNDNDGMADEWERRFFGNTDRGSGANSSSDADGDGYTDLEEYLYNIDPNVANSNPGSTPIMDLPARLWIPSVRR
jgi:pectate lyase